MDTVLDAGGPAASRLSIAAAAMPFMKTLRSSFKPAASPGRGPDHFDGHPERPEELGEAFGARSRRQRRRRQTEARDDADQSDVGELHRQRRRELPLELRRRSVQIGVERAAAKLAGDALRGIERDRPPS